jgi:hypothetical protein
VLLLAAADDPQVHGAATEPISISQLVRLQVPRGPAACNEFFRPETVDAFEIGPKSSFANGALQLNLTAFASCHH